MPARRTAPGWAPATALAALLLAVLSCVYALPASAALPTIATGHARTAEPAEPDPISVSIDDLTPSMLKADPTHGSVHVAGTITNDDDQTWQDINVHAFVGSSPLTTETELTEASLSDIDQQVGNRITAFGDFSTVPTLAPGQSASYALTIPRVDLRDSAGQPITHPGVYWFGVQVLGTDTEGRDDAADGRARTFLPLVDRSAHPGDTERAALAVSLRQRVLRQPDGTIASTEAWARRLSPGGRLANLLDFASGHAVSWLVDPAVIDAVQQLADGNPPRSIAPTDGSADPQPPSANSTGGERSTTDDTATLARSWLSRLIDVLHRSDVYALPYGDTDLAATARHDPSLYDVARRRSSETFAALGISATPVDAPINGYLQADALGLGDSSTDLLLTDQAISGTVPATATVGGRSVITTSSLVASGGPPPGDHLGLVPVRQELLAQAATRLGTGDPVVAVMPANWSPGSDDAGFFAGLQRKWLELGSIQSAVSRSIPLGVGSSRLRYPSVEAEAELPAATFAAVKGLRAAGSTLQSVVRHNDTIGTTVLDEALTSASYTARGGADGAAAERSRQGIQAMLNSIQIEAPPAVTLSSDTGRFNVTVINGLEQNITIKVVAEGDQGMTISGAHKLEIPAKSRTGVLLTARTHTNGVHTVVLRITDPEGAPLGSRASLPIRSAQVSRIIWLFIGCGVGLLFTAIVARLVRRLRRGSGRPDGGPEGGPVTGPEGDIGAEPESQHDSEYDGDRA